MKKIIAFGASTSNNSINKILATYVAKLIQSNSEILDLNEFPAPIYSIDYEEVNGVPEAVKNFTYKIQSADAIIISMAEHNGSYTAAFKNLFDWSSRFNAKIFENKKLLLLSTSPGGRGGISALEAAANRFPFHGAEIIDKFSLPFFDKNFKENKIIDADLHEILNSKLMNFKKVLEI